VYSLDYNKTRFQQTFRVSVETLFSGQLNYFGPLDDYAQLPLDFLGVLSCMGPTLSGLVPVFNPNAAFSLRPLTTTRLNEVFSVLEPGLRLSLSRSFPLCRARTAFQPPGTW